MTRWSVQDSLDLALAGIDRVLVRMAGGAVRASTEAGPARCRITRLDGEAVDVCLEGGTLRVLHPAPLWDGSDVTSRGLQEAELVLSVPPGCELDVSTDTATISLSGFGDDPRIDTRAGRIVHDVLKAS